MAVVAEVLRLVDGVVNCEFSLGHWLMINLSIREGYQITTSRASAWAGCTACCDRSNPTPKDGACLYTLVSGPRYRHLSNTASGAGGVKTDGSRDY